MGLLPPTHTHTPFLWCCSLKEGLQVPPPQQVTAGKDEKSLILQAILPQAFPGIPLAFTLPPPKHFPLDLTGKA